MIRYICKYTPLELFESFGLEPEIFNAMLPDSDAADDLTHRNMCGFSRVLLADRIVNNSDMLVLTDCCDSIRRAADVLESAGQKIMRIALPHRQDEKGQKLYKEELLRIVRQLEELTETQFDPETFLSAFSRDEQSSGPYIAVLGARIGNEIFNKIQSVSPYPVRNQTCIGNRRLGTPIGNNLDRLMEWYAHELLSQPACMRMTDIASRRSLTEDPDLRGVIYNTVAFCDFYGFEYALLRGNLRVPLLKIETDYTIQGIGQLQTRLQAFFENVKPTRKMNHTGKNQRMSGYYAGIDSGSTTTNAVIMDNKKQILASSTIPTGVQIMESANRALEEALLKADIKRKQISRTVTTGYGRAGISFREKEVTEITCHAKGAFFLNPAVRTVIDIGGQDSKVIRLDENGNVYDFVMNDKCAAGTGRFLELMSQSLGLTMEEMGTRGIDTKEDIVISSMCSVFAQSEVVSLIASGKRVEDIIHGLNRSIAAKVLSLAGRKVLEREWMMTGGVARNAGVVNAVEEKLGGKVIVPDEPEICGAIGAALVAIDIDE
ncbi:MAG TPA: acyl-CoA dehydratase activase [Flexilinea sp.]|nr:acyl-CoA dehydratase activase [Flexilinea sp.]HPJ65382.1 acyl-CoA dehydratase activase [Flexilinea sp.]HPR71454.1 acyl-CoA dehydratase activase [Flexilinea sp.]